MTSRLRLGSTAEETAKLIAADATALITELLDHQDRVDVVLTGGTMGIRLLAEMALLPITTDLDWSRVHFWWGDERWVAADSPDRNAGQARNALLDQLPIGPENVHAMPADDGRLELADAATDYAAELAVASPDGRSVPEFDLVFLGIGPDGHIASLFPGTPQLFEKDAYVVPVGDSPKPPPERISLSYRALNAAKRIWFVAAGAEKAIAVQLALRGFWFVDLPASGAHGSSETVWYVDEAAAQDFDDMLIERFTDA